MKLDKVCHDRKIGQKKASITRKALCHFSATSSK